MRRLVEGFPRITVDPAQMGGKPCIRGIRVTVGMIVGNLEAGVPIDRLLELYPYIEREDVLESARFAAQIGPAAKAELLRGTHGSTDPADIGDLVCGTLRAAEADLTPGSFLTIEDNGALTRAHVLTASSTDKTHG